MLHSKLARITLRNPLLFRRHAIAHGLNSIWRRCLLTLAIETSCDDTSVAIIEKHGPAHPSSPSSNERAATIHFLENITADTRQYRGIHPIEALHSHQVNLTKLVQKALQHLPVVPTDATNSIGGVGRSGRNLFIQNAGRRRLPDFIAVTRGPGMQSNLSVGLDTAKGLSVAWQVPFVGVHHMQAHLLTPRLVSALNIEGALTSTSLRPNFPFLSILISGGHSMLVNSKSITDHEILATTADIAIGDALDKSARLILPETLLQAAENTMYGKMLEQYAFPSGPADYADYRPAMNRGEEQIKRESPWGWSITTPFANTRELQFSFSCVSSTVNRLISAKKQAGQMMLPNERVDFAREVMRVCFEHLVSRTIIALEGLRKMNPNSREEFKTLVVSGGVAANRFLMTVLRSHLDVRGFEHIEIIAPPPYLCTDNAAMIGWAAIEMSEAGWSTDLSSRALRKWSLDPRSGDGGILGPDGWTKLET